MNDSAGTITSSPGPTPAAASAMWSAEVPLFVARQKRVPTAAANSASRAFASGAAAPESTPRSSTRATAARSLSVKIGQRRGFIARRILEEARQMRHRAGLARPLGELGEPHQIQHERRGEDRVAPLPVTKRELPLR